LSIDFFETGGLTDTFASEAETEGTIDELTSLKKRQQRHA